MTYRFISGHQDLCKQKKQKQATSQIKLKLWILQENAGFDNLDSDSPESSSVLIFFLLKMGLFK